MADNVAITAGTGTTVAADDVGGILHQRVKLSLGADGTANDAVAGSGVNGTGVQRVTIATDDAINTALAALSQRWAFSVTNAPTVTNGAYSAGDIIGGLLTFSNVARATDELFIVTGVEVNIKSAVTPGLTLVLFDADPNTNAYTDNAAYNIAAGDAAKILKAIPISTLFDNGTPNSYSVDGLFVVCSPISGTRNVYGLLVDSVGVTLTSTSDVSIRLRGIGI